MGLKPSCVTDTNPSPPQEPIPTAGTHPRRIYRGGSSPGQCHQCWPGPKGGLPPPTPRLPSLFLPAPDVGEKEGGHLSFFITRALSSRSPILCIYGQRPPL